MIRTVNKGDRVVDLCDAGMRGVVERPGPVTYVHWEYEYENDDDTVTTRMEYCPYRIWQLTWSDDHDCWTIDEWGITAYEYRTGAEMWK